MEDKKSFGKYITEKRKEAGLTQEELADKLYVIPTTVSKWERGISYPDITMVTSLCKELNISQHEFFTACDDVVREQEQKEIKRYQTIKKVIYYSISISYLIALISCLICNIVIDHTISWFLIVLTSIGISFSITNLPLYLKKDKYRVIKSALAATLFIYMLLFVTNFVTSSNWLYTSFAIATFELGLCWIGIIICTFLKIDKLYKVSICLVLLAICTAFTNPFLEEVLNVPTESINSYNNLVAIILVIVAIILSIIKLSNNKIKKVSS